MSTPEDRKYYKESSGYTVQMFGKGLQIINNLLNGFKNLHNLSEPITFEETLNDPQKLMITHDTIITKIHENYQICLPEDVKSNIVFEPYIHSGKMYIKDFSDSVHMNFEDDVIVLGVVLKYKDYCTKFVRTIIVTDGHTKEIEESIEILSKFHSFLRTLLVDGSQFGSVFDKGLYFLQKQNPHLAQHVVDNFGSLSKVNCNRCIFIEKDNPTIASYGMIINLNLLLKNMPYCKASDQYYTLQISDDIMVNKKKPATCLKTIRDKIIVEKKIF